MAVKLTGILILLVLSVGCQAVGRPAPLEDDRRYSMLGAEQQAATAAQNSIKLVQISSNVRLGGSARLVIQGVPGINYNATASYRVRDKLATATQSVLSDINGVATWYWQVRGDTVPGTYPITVSGGGRTFITYYTVTP